MDTAIVPRWLRLNAIGAAEYRAETTLDLTTLINRWGYLEMATQMSDLQTTFTIFDLKTRKIPQIMDDLSGIPHFHCDLETENILEHCIQLVTSGGQSRQPKLVRANLQVMWSGATGDLKRHVVADG